MVFVGTEGAPPHAFPAPPHTTVGHTPKVREKPFLFVTAEGEYRVFVPALRIDSRGTSWESGTPAGTSFCLTDFFVALPVHSAAEVNVALAEGKHVLFTPGVYRLDEPITVRNPGTVLLGIGLATLMPVRGTAALLVSDVDGVTVAGLLIDAGPIPSRTLVEIGEPGANDSHSDDPTLLSDVFVRIGGGGAGAADVSIVINSNDVIADHLWLWRADHGDGVGWTTNRAATGLIVRGRDVTIYGLYVEHYQGHNVLWHGDSGRTFLFQHEFPYDAPNQRSWSNLAGYTIEDSVTTHEAWGLGSYCYFEHDSSIVADRGFRVPDVSGVRLHGVVTASLGGVGAIRNVVNNEGGRVDATTQVRFMAHYPAAPRRPPGRISVNSPRCLPRGTI